MSLLDTYLNQTSEFSDSPYLYFEKFLWTDCWLSQKSAGTKYGNAFYFPDLSPTIRGHLRRRVFISRECLDGRETTKSPIVWDFSWHKKIRLIKGGTRANVSCNPPWEIIAEYLARELRPGSWNSYPTQLQSKIYYSNIWFPTWTLFQTWSRILFLWLLCYFSFLMLRLMSYNKVYRFSFPYSLPYFSPKRQIIQQSRNELIIDICSHARMTLTYPPKVRILLVRL